MAKSGIRNVSIEGNLVDVPESKFTASGDLLVKFTVAVNSRERNQETGEWQDSDPAYIRCTAWRRIAENISESNFAKGTRVVVLGDYQASTVEDADGKSRVFWDLQVRSFGPSLAWATAQVTRNAPRDNGNAPAAAPAAAGGQQFQPDEPPF